MNKTILLTAAATLCSLTLNGQIQKPFKGSFYDKEHDIRLQLNLYEENIDIPGLEFIGPTHGYLQGDGLYNIWAITSMQMPDSTRAIASFSNDLGSETQKTELTLLGDTAVQVHQLDGVLFKKVVKRKLVKHPATLIFKREQKR